MFSGDSDELDTNLKAWKVSEITPKSIMVGLEFKYPNSVSLGQYPDFLFIEINLGEYLDLNGQKLPQSVLIYVDLPVQSSSMEEGNYIKGLIDMTSSAFISVGVLSVLFNILMKGSIARLWSLINC